MITKSIKSLFTACLLCCGGAAALTACSDLMDTDSELVEFQEDNRLQLPTDSVYSLMGIIYKMQVVADRTVLLGELRSDLTTTQSAASSDLKAITRFEVGVDNAYNRISDYYAIINNCNYYLANINMNLSKNGRTIFESEYAAVKAYRAWTYFQLAQIYGSVPLITEPVLTEEAAKTAMQQTPSDMAAICDYFITDLKPYVDTKLPAFQISTQITAKLFIPVRALLGDLCLWAGRYQEAAQYYHDYLSLRTNPVRTGVARARWYDASTKEFRTISTSLTFSPANSECLCYIPMESNEFYGVTSQLSNIFSSTNINKYYAQVMPTQRLRQLSAEPNYCVTYAKVDQTIDTIYAPKENLTKSEYVGDLRFGAIYFNYVYNQERFSRVSNELQTINKFSTMGVTLYRTSMLYLRYAEALNRAGYPQSAFAVLKYGLYPDIVAKHVDDAERTAAGTLIDFDVDLFSLDNTQGIHSRGCGDADCDTLYCLPQPAAALATRSDTVAYQIPLVEDMIISEMALEGAFEGYRFYDLMRVAKRRGDNAYLADAVARRDGTLDAALRTFLMDDTNWYLPRP
mgnify:CR=1 FL=1